MLEKSRVACMSWLGSVVAAFILTGELRSASLCELVWFGASRPVRWCHLTSPCLSALPLVQQCELTSSDLPLIAVVTNTSSRLLWCLVTMACRLDTLVCWSNKQ